MATKSILKTIMLKKPKAAQSLVSALENADGKSSKKVTMSRTYKELNKDDVKKMFGANDGRV